MSPNSSLTLAETALGTPDVFYLDGLNAEQRQAVETVDGPLLVLAGAGTGKTRVLTSRIGHILAMQKAWPSQILAVTFTNKAAAEMKVRIEKVLQKPVEGLWLGTFHSLCVRILRRHAELLGFHSNFTILDTDDQLRLIKQIIVAEGVDDKKNPPRIILGRISSWKDQGITPDKVGSLHDVYGGIYKHYQERLKILNAMDFGDLLLYCLELFMKHPEVLSQYHQQFRYILVDEYQDTNVSQYLWLRLLAQGTGNICCVGDDDQSIYSWRGAEISNILRFEKDFKGATLIRLEQNYRSTTHILSAASKLISNNTGRLGKTLWTQQEGGEKLYIQGVWDAEEEARIIGDKISYLAKKGHPLNGMAILVRASFQTREFEDRLLILQIPYRVIGGPRFYERLEIRDALAYLRIVVQPDDALAFERIVNTPKRGIGATTLQQIHLYARENHLSLPQAAYQLTQTDALRGKVRVTIAALLQDITRWRTMMTQMGHVQLAQIILDESGYTSMWQADKTPEAPGRLENLKELIKALEEFENLQGFLEHVTLVMENNRQQATDQVTMMTLHGAKGLEYDTVFLGGWEEGLFPHPRALQETGRDGLEEERRLAYVGITRAKQRAFISFAANRRIHGSWQSTPPSRFLTELPKEHIHIIEARGQYATSRFQEVDDHHLPQDEDW